jgi:hypothetical protein
MCPQIALLEYELLCPHSLTYYELVEARQCGAKRARTLMSLSYEKSNTSKDCILVLLVHKSWSFRSMQGKCQWF